MAIATTVNYSPGSYYDTGNNLPKKNYIYIGHKRLTRPAPVVSNRPPAAVPALARHARTPPTPLARTLFRVLSLSQQTHIKIVSARPQRGDGGGSKFWGAPWASRFARARPHSYPNSRPSIGDLPSAICHHHRRHVRYLSTSRMALQPSMASNGQ
jgi:hypothetical protein